MKKTSIMILTIVICTSFFSTAFASCDDYIFDAEYELPDALESTKNAKEYSKEASTLTYTTSDSEAICAELKSALDESNDAIYSYINVQDVYMKAIKYCSASKKIKAEKQYISIGLKLASQNEMNKRIIKKMDTYCKED